MRTWFSYSTMKCYIFSKETVIRETKKVSFANSNLEVVSHGERKQEKETNQNTGETYALQVFIDLYIVQYLKNMHYCVI